MISMTLVLLFICYGLVLSAALSYRGIRSDSADPAECAERKHERILVVGATGGTGRQVVAQALERGYVVTAFARNPSDLGIEHPRLSVVRGDVLDSGQVETAMRGQDAVICALGHKRYVYPGHILSEGTRHILRAMEKQSVPRLVCETAMGLGDSAGRLGLYYTLFVIPVILPFYFWDKARQERLISESLVEWVIVRPGALTNGEKRGRIRQGKAAGNFVTTVRISRADVAGFMLDQISDNRWVRAAPGICW